jgi:hypothetical protein
LFLENISKVPYSLLISIDAIDCKEFIVGERLSILLDFLSCIAWTLSIDSSSDDSEFEEIGLLISSDELDSGSI